MRCGVDLKSLEKAEASRTLEFSWQTAEARSTKLRKSGHVRMNKLWKGGKLT